MNEEYSDWIKMKAMLPEPEKKALRELLDAALTRSDAGSMVPRVIPSETMFMLMLVHLKTKINELDERTRKWLARETVGSESKVMKAGWLPYRNGFESTPK